MKLLDKKLNSLFTLSGFKKDKNKRFIKYIFVGLIILIPLLFHLDWLIVFKFPFVFPDSFSYYGPAGQFIFNGSFNLDPTRTPGYPFFLYIILYLTKSFFAVIAVQHLLALMTSLLAGWIFLIDSF